MERMMKRYESTKEREEEVGESIVNEGETKGENVMIFLLTRQM